jgi:hypothetical protein
MKTGRRSPALSATKHPQRIVDTAKEIPCAEEMFFWERMDAAGADMNDGRDSRLFRLAGCQAGP